MCFLTSRVLACAMLLMCAHFPFFALDLVLSCTNFVVLTSMLTFTITFVLSCTVLRTCTFLNHRLCTMVHRNTSQTRSPCFHGGEALSAVSH